MVRGLGFLLLSLGVGGIVNYLLLPAIGMPTISIPVSIILVVFGIVILIVLLMQAYKRTHSRVHEEKV